jgi:hypothetical protein
LTSHDVRTVPEMGWSGTKDGNLLRVMAADGFEVLLTADRNLRHQQNPQTVDVIVVVLVAASNRLADLMPLTPYVLTALRSLRPGDVVEITADD